MKSVVFEDLPYLIVNGLLVIIAPVGLELVESELGNAECANKPWKNNGDCVANSYDEFCEESWINHDCWY